MSAAKRTIFHEMDNFAGIKLMFFFSAGGEL